MREIEILVELHTNMDEAKKKLNHLEFKGSKSTIDKYFYDPLRNNLQLNENNKLLECCRLRTKNNKHFATYKIDIYDGEIWKYSNEEETEIQNFEALQNLFINLGLKELVVIDNIKHTYLTDNFEIVLEEVKELGNFLEVEYCFDDNTKTVDEVKNEIQNFIESLGLEIGQELNSGKPELLILKRQRNTTPNN
jgi:adenylate cyclase, class 2